MEIATAEAENNPIEAESEKQSAVEKNNRVRSYIELTKPRIALMLVLTAAAGFYIGSKETFNWKLFAETMSGIALLAFGVATLNQYIERNIDALMTRTANRPLPSGKINFKAALIFGIVLCAAAEIILWLTVNPLTALLGFSVIVGYVLLYTPLKTKTSVSTVIGAFPGAMPPLMGFTAAANELTLEAFILFAILFLWQFPHFLAIAWLYKEDYAKAGIKMLPVVERTGAITISQIILFTLMTIAASILPYILATAGEIYLCGAVVLGLWLLYGGLRMAQSRDRVAARRVLLISVIYLPILYGLMVFNQK